MRIIHILLAAALLSLTACASAKPRETPPLSVTGAMAGETVFLVPGQMLVVTLPANPSTGYSWKADEIPACIRAVGGGEYRPDPTRIDMPGAGGAVVWKFRAAAEGSGVLRLTYLRPWEHGVPPMQAVEYTLNCKKNK